MKQYKGFMGKHFMYVSIVRAELAIFAGNIAVESQHLPLLLLREKKSKLITGFIHEINII